MTAASSPQSPAATGPDAGAIPRPFRTIALVGLMGVGKSTVGRRLAHRLGLPFEDGDEAIEIAARMSVSDIFAQLGEAEFRAGEARVMRRLLEGPRIVLATGGGAVLNPDTRALLQTRATTVVSQPPRLSISPRSLLLNRSHASWTASSASLTEPSIR